MPETYDQLVERLASLVENEEFEIIEKAIRIPDPRYRNEKRHTTYFYHKRTGQQFALDVRYRLGGMNYFSSRTEARGFVMSVSPMSLRIDEGKVIGYTYEAYTGYKELVEAANRYNEKKLDKHAETFTLDHKLVRAYIGRIMKEKGLLDVQPAA